MTFGRLVVSIAIAASFPSMATPATLEELRALYMGERYEEVLPLLLAYRAAPDGRIWQVDFMIGASECRIPALVNQGIAVLSTLLVNGRLSDEARAGVLKELGSCDDRTLAAGVDPGFELASVTLQVTDAPIVSGKGGYEVSRTETSEAGTETTPVPVADLRKRVFPKNQMEDALRAARSRMPGGWVVPAGDFVIAGDTRLEFPAADIAACLTRYRKLLSAQFAMTLPPGLVSVYVARDLEGVKAFARTLHGVNLTLDTVAYSVYEDLSIVGMAAAGSCGSLAHEMVHLAIRRNFGDSPAWLEEGVASEVAVAYPAADRFRFESSWRDAVLKRHWGLRPTVADLLKADWARLAARDKSEAARVAALQAMAAVFVRYLDAKGKLLAVYQGMRDDRWSASGRLTRTAEDIVTERTGMSLDQIEADFQTWFGYKPPQPALAPTDARQSEPQSPGKP